MSLPTDTHRDLTILESIEKNPDASQATLAAQLGVAVGTINWHLKRLIAKGYVKVRRAERRKLRYIITPEGIALRAHLTVDYIQNQFHLYRQIRQRVSGILNEVRSEGYQRVRLIGDGDVADICRLTCLEYGFEIVSDSHAPLLVVRDLKISIEMEEQHQG